MSQRIACKVTIVNRLGLHARPAMCFVDAATPFKSEITVCRVGSGSPVDGKSIMQMMMLAATKGTELEIVAVGDDAQAACDALSKLVQNGFDED